MQAVTKSKGQKVDFSNEFGVAFKICRVKKKNGSIEEKERSEESIVAKYFTVSYKLGSLG